MTAFLETLRSGAWLTRDRVRLVALAVLAASVIGTGYLLATSNGLNDRLGRPLGTDFANVYAAGSYVLDGQAAAPFDPAKQFAREQAIFGPATQFYGWHYPPFFLGLAALLALMPYALSLTVWQGATLALYLCTIRMIVRVIVPSPRCGEGQGEGGRVVRSVPPHPVAQSATGLSPAGRGKDDGFAVGTMYLLLALAFPAVFINLGHGHNGFLTAAIFAAALLQLDKRPVVAGVLFGLLAYKPQFAVLVPLVLAATGRWRTFAAAAATVVLLALAVTAAFGPEVWRAFIASTKFTREIVLERGDTGWHKIQSVFSWVRMWGGGVTLAYAVQGAVSVVVAGALIWLWRGSGAFAPKAAALLIGTVLATPYSLDYDLMLLAPAIAFLTADGFTRGFAPWDKTLLAALWIVPLVSRSIAEATLIPLAVPVMLASFAAILHTGLAGSVSMSLMRRPAE
jgi:alpha-1,2-mannosyltransferase